MDEAASESTDARFRAAARTNEFRRLMTDPDEPISMKGRFRDPAELISKK